MLLLDYFAAKAMQALLATNPHDSHNVIAHKSYSRAAAMMEVRDGVKLYTQEEVDARIAAAIQERRECGL